MQQAKWIKLSHFSCLRFPLVLSPFSFSQDVPKDYRHVSLTGVKQRFEDEAYQHISKEKVLDLFLCFFIIADQGKYHQTLIYFNIVAQHFFLLLSLKLVTDIYSMAFLKVMDFKELCQILEIPEEEPQMEPPSPTGQPADIHAFLASPSSTSKR